MFLNFVFIFTNINVLNATRYKAEVGDCKLVFVSFLPQNEKGIMVEEVASVTGTRYSLLVAFSSFLLIHLQTNAIQIRQVQT